jgi:serine/threonine protein kinase
MAADLVGQIIDGRYRVLAKLGAGGAGAVYRAERAGGGPHVALKMLHDEYGTDPESQERFQREGRALSGLQHPNIVGVVDFGMTPEGPFLVMELLDGMPLDAFLEQQDPPPGLAFELGKQVVAGLAYAHAQGVLHRDMKTENVFVARLADGSYVAKILDFGLAKFVDDERWGPAKKLTMMGAVFGSPAYMSPEQATGQKVDMRSDVYSTGIVLFEVLTGTWPFLAEEQMEMLRMHLTAPVPDLAATKEGLEVRPELQAVVARAMEKMPDRRFANAGEMLAALHAIPQPAAWMRSAAPAQVARPAVPASAASAQLGAPPPSGGVPVGLIVGVVAGLALLGALALGAAFLLFG